MLAVQHVQSHEVPSSPGFGDGSVKAQMRNKATRGRELKQDKNFNFVVEDASAKNANVVLGETASPPDHCVAEDECQPRDVQQAGRHAAYFLAPASASAPDCPALESGRLKPLSVESARLPQGGATETGHGHKPNPSKDYEEFAVSPSDDNGYSSSCLSIESPDSVDGSIWEMAGSATQDVDLASWPREEEEEEEEEEEDASLGSLPVSPTASGSFLPLLLEAVQNLQEKQRFKEQEREKHQTKVIMYRRLALLRWIRNLQQKVVDHQSRLQDSYDTILSNRKELLKFIKQGVI